MNKLIKVFSIVFLTFLPSIVWGGNIDGTGWFFEDNNGAIKIILFENDQTFTYLKETSHSGNEGRVFGDDEDTWIQDEDLVTISYNDGYMLCSLNLTGTKRMSGTCINKVGEKREVKGRLVE
jgi:hypothetical protein